MALTPRQMIQVAEWRNFRMHCLWMKHRCKLGWDNYAAERDIAVIKSWQEGSGEYEQYADQWHQWMPYGDSHEADPTDVRAADRLHDPEL